MEKVSHIDERELWELLDEAQAVLKLVNERFEHQRRAEWSKLLTETILLLEGELHQRVEQTELDLIQDAAREVSNTISRDSRDRSASAQTTPEFTVPSDSSQDLEENPVDEGGKEYNRVKKHIREIREKIDASE